MSLEDYMAKSICRIRAQLIDAFFVLFWGLELFSYKLENSLLFIDKITLILNSFSPTFSISTLFI